MRKPIKVFSIINTVDHLRNTPTHRLYMINHTCQQIQAKYMMQKYYNLLDIRAFGNCDCEIDCALCFYGFANTKNQNKCKFCVCVCVWLHQKWQKINWTDWPRLYSSSFISFGLCSFWNRASRRRNTFADLKLKSHNIGFYYWHHATVLSKHYTQPSNG